MINVISLGGGKQSSFMLLQALEGVFKHKPDFAIIADTGNEPKYVYDYIKWLTDHVKQKYDFDIITVSAGNIYDDILSYVDGKRKRAAQIPLKLESGGITPRQCTYDYKIAPIRMYLQSIRKGQKVRLWIGISLDEIQRIKESNVKYIEHYYPLIEKRISIDGIVKWFDESGLKVPGKSACLICPFHSDGYWKRVKKEFPDEFNIACRFDDKIRNYPNLKDRVYLSNHRKPLSKINFQYKATLFPELIEECDGLCGL